MPRRRASDPRKTPLQARSRDTYDTILEATARILETKGLEAANTNAIAERAGISVGSYVGRLISGTGLGSAAKRALRHAAGASSGGELEAGSEGMGAPLLR